MLRAISDTGTPPFKDAMFADLHGWRWRNINDFSTPSQTDATQAQITLWAHREVMVDDVGGHGSATRPIVPGLALLARRFLFSSWLFDLRFHEGWRRFLLFQFFNPPKGDTQQFLHLLQCFTQVLVFLAQVPRFFFCHALSLSERSSLNCIAYL